MSKSSRLFSGVIKLYGDINFQQFQKALADDNNKFTNIKKQLEMSHSE